MITSTELYWISRLDNIHNLFLVLSVFAPVVLLIMLIEVCIKCDEIPRRKPTRSESCRLSVAALVVVLCVSCLVLVPTTKEMIVIKAVPAMLDSKFVSETVPKESAEIYGLVKDYLKSKLEVEKK